ncbi:MAG: aminomethyl-transferring glycine dehydrogenase subunit GcvPA [Planctomycetota bacterium]|nr:MAG: aminomethyl-transferring glycine dehydrogenase subunit GcvPA [Planctomycetota bacterium]
MTYLVNTPEQCKRMLQAVGATDIEELFDTIPQAIRLQRPLPLPPALGEMELERLVRDRAAQQTPLICFAGGGAYDHFIPAVVDEIAGRGEFYTAYTPYQPEASQGSLQAFFEYQTLMCQLTDMDVSNASLYEGATAVSEAVFMAMRVTRRYGRVVVAESVHPEYRRVLTTYLSHHACRVHTVAAAGGCIDPDDVRPALTPDTAAVVIQHPNVFGCLENVAAVAEQAHAAGALLIEIFDPLSLGLLKPPGQLGADIAVAEGQSLGIPLSYGGPYLGILTTRREFIRQIPGRLVGETTDRRGRRCYVLSIQTREQHIRREKATSNICTNQGLMALRATVYLALLGPQGLRELGELCLQKAHYAARRLTECEGLELAFDVPFFKEFTLRVRGGAASLRTAARRRGFLVGPAIGDFPDTPFTGIPDPHQLLLCAVTERRTRSEIDDLADACRSSRETVSR